MGIQGLLPILKPLITDCNIDQFGGKRIAVDGYVWLHKAVYNCCMELCNDIETDVWIKYFLGMVDLLLHSKIKVTVVFDGSNLPAKRGVEISRSTTRQANIQKAKLYENSGDLKNARLYYSRATFATPRMAAILIKIMRKSHPMVKCIVSPYEADAQLSYLSIHNLVDMVISEDSDNIPYGCKDILFKLDFKGNCQRLVLSDVYSRVIPGFDLRTFDQQMLISMCIVSGCDYLSSVKGMGLKNSYKVVHKQRSAGSILRNMRITGLVPLIPAHSSHKQHQAEGSGGSGEGEYCSSSQESTGGDALATAAAAAEGSGSNSSDRHYRRVVDDCGYENMKLLPTNVLLYEVEFYKALATFNHQTVFDPIARKIVHRTPIIHDALPHCLQILYPLPLLPPQTAATQGLNGNPPAVSTAVLDLPFLGTVHIPDSIACGIADGLLDPSTMLPFDLPEHLERPLATIYRSTSVNSNGSSYNSSGSQGSSDGRSGGAGGLAGGAGGLAGSGGGSIHMNASYQYNSVFRSKTVSAISAGNSNNSKILTPSYASHAQHQQQQQTNNNTINNGKRKLPGSITNYFAVTSTTSASSSSAVVENNFSSHSISSSAASIALTYRSMSTSSSSLIATGLNPCTGAGAGVGAGYHSHHPPSGTAVMSTSERLSLSNGGGGGSGGVGIVESTSTLAGKTTSSGVAERTTTTAMTNNISRNGFHEFECLSYGTNNDDNGDGDLSKNYDGGSGGVATSGESAAKKPRTPPTIDSAASTSSTNTLVDLSVEVDGDDDDDSSPVMMGISTGSIGSSSSGGGSLFASFAAIIDTPHVHRAASYQTPSTATTTATDTASSVFTASSTSSSSLSAGAAAAMFDVYGDVSDSSDIGSGVSSATSSAVNSPAGMTGKCKSTGIPVASTMQQKYTLALESAMMKSNSDSKRKAPLSRQKSLPVLGSPHTQLQMVSVKSSDSLKRLNSIRITQAQLALRNSKVDDGDDDDGCSAGVTMTTATDGVASDKENDGIACAAGDGAMSYEHSLSPPVNKPSFSRTEDSNPFARFML